MSAIRDNLAQWELKTSNMNVLFILICALVYRVSFSITKAYIMRARSLISFDFFLARSKRMVV